MLENDSFRKLSDWTMGTTVKQEKNLNCTEKNFAGRSVFPVWQMVQDDEEEETDDYDIMEEFDGDSVTHLTGNVRACYLNHLEKIVIKNYEACSAKDRNEWPFSLPDLIKCAAWMEYKALRSCMVVVLYQRAMTRLASDIKKHTEQLKIYRKLKHFMSFDTGWATKTTQTCERYNFMDQATQTDPDPEAEEVNLCTDFGEFAYETPTALGTDINNECVQSFNSVSECAKGDTTQGVPIPVYVSGVSSSGFKSRNSQNIRVVKTIEPVPFSEANTVQKFPIVNGIETNQSVHIPYEEETNEPYKWSVIEENDTLKTSLNSCLRVRRLSNMQENKPLSNGLSTLSKDDEETHKMTLDEKIAAVFGIENTELSDEEGMDSEKSKMEVDEEPGLWTVQKCQHQQMLRTKILEKCVVDIRKRGQMRLRFLELFGSDSEDCFDIDEDVTIYRDKLARWVVMCLMPYYREGRILSRPVFKFLARHMADNLLKTNRWLSESDVMQNVVQFFTYHNKIECIDDILS
ncbi:hypothetical protein L9F63_001538 [Diploptera punctata]|uniref:Set2 Rpb1 interacting domain-containing protein n=1 Tax=Diploptera punctata TaxID=6984 RepID=A0AAD8A3V4_DIPPU|nr:hypothetical protein L9F63_001538 [Diploptera punctata]